MALDLAPVAAQLRGLFPALRRAAQERETAWTQARRVRAGAVMDWAALKERLEERRPLLSFTLPAGLTEDPAATYPLPQLPQEYAVVATDGSQIDLDRHAPLPCYLINLGQVLIQYGSAPQARLSSLPTLALAGVSEESEQESDEEARAHQDRVHVDLERSVAEIRGLVELAEAEEAAPFTVALLDGSLILWTASAARYQRETEGYVRAYVGYLERLQQLARTKPLAVASYISYPGSAEVVNALRVAFCTAERSYCQARCRGPREEARPCDILNGLLDRTLFSTLREGERSAVFTSHPRVMESYPQQSQVHFFYLNAGPEVGRIEVPAWVAQDPELLERTHAAVYDQCRRNFGYPVALMEAHEQAVVSERDRQAFWQMVYQGLTLEALPAGDSAKSRSKRVPWS